MLRIAICCGEGFASGFLSRHLAEATVKEKLQETQLLPAALLFSYCTNWAVMLIFSADVIIREIQISLFPPVGFAFGGLLQLFALRAT